VSSLVNSNCFYWEECYQVSFEVCHNVRNWSPASERWDWDFGINDGGDRGEQQSVSIFGGEYIVLYDT
jgi:hypothetical protein